MRRYDFFLLLSLALAFVLSCSGGGRVNPVTPVADSDMTCGISSHAKQSQTCLWGYYDVSVDIGNLTVQVVPNRHAMFTVNVTNHLNRTAAIRMKLNSVAPGPEWIDVDVDVSITHPFPGMTEFNGYDVRGVFMGDGSATLAYNNPKLIYAVDGTDQYMLPDPDDEIGGPDGYTRWFNYTEFSEGGAPLFQYTEGNLATKGYHGTATINPYKYFAGGLESTDDLWEWLNDHPGYHGQFSSGTTNTRNYYIRFPESTDVTFGYAVIADWEGLEPEYHPANAPEALSCRVEDFSSIYYFDESNNGGTLELDISLFGWKGLPSSIWIDSTVLRAPYQLTDDEMVPVAGTDTYSTYHVEIPADNVTDATDQEYWIIPEYDEYDYSNRFGVPNLAWDDPIAAFFRYELDVVGGWARTWGNEHDAVLRQDPVVAVDQWDNAILAGYFIGSVDFDPGPGEDIQNAVLANDVYLSKFDPAGNHIWTRTWGGEGVDNGTGVATDDAGNILVTGIFYRNVDFDPGPGEDWHRGEGNADCFLSKFDPDGNFQWARTWGTDEDTSWHGSHDEAYAVATDSEGNASVSGLYRGIADFDPGPGEDWHDRDGTFLSKFDPSGNFLWANTWAAYGFAHGVATDLADNIFVSGDYTYNVDLDPGPGEDWHDADDGIYLSKFSPSGAYIWGKSWGRNEGIRTYTVDTDPFGNAYITGPFDGPSDLDPGPGEDIHTDRDGCFLSKFNSSGELIWARSWGGEHGEPSPLSVSADGLGNVCVTGYFRYHPVDFDPGPGEDIRMPVDRQDIFISKFDAFGNYRWVLTWGTEEDESGQDVVLTDSYIYLTGHYSLTVDFDPGLTQDLHTSNGLLDSFLVKFKPDGTW